MTKLIRAGFFREMPHGEPSDPSLAAARTDAPGPHQEAIAAYLDAGHIYIATPGPTKDVIDRRTLIGPAHYLTDGRFVWPGDAAHYVRNYNVRMPPAFVEHIMAQGFIVPKSVDLSALKL
jgi:hypothetical protein